MVITPWPDHQRQRRANAHSIGLDTTTRHVYVPTVNIWRTRAARVRNRGPAGAGRLNDVRDGIYLASAAVARCDPGNITRRGSSRHSLGRYRVPDLCLRWVVETGARTGQPGIRAAARGCRFNAAASAPNRSTHRANHRTCNTSPNGGTSSDHGIRNRSTYPGCGAAPPRRCGRSRTLAVSAEWVCGSAFHTHNTA